MGFTAKADYEKKLIVKPLVSILIPAYNAERWVGEAIQSAVRQTWPRKEIIVIDDGSTDRTGDEAKRFVPAITLVRTENRGASAARNHALRLSHGDYIQWLDADDVLMSDKIERQLEALREGESERILLASSWAPFHYRTRNVHFVQNSLCQDLSPVEWLLRKMGENLHMQTATWLVSRELTGTAGDWDPCLSTDDDGEYFARVLKCSAGTRFVAGTGVYYRMPNRSSLSYIGNSDKKKDSMFLSMKLHIQYIRSLEDSERVRSACITYMQNWFHHFYPSRQDIAAELQRLAAQLGGQLVEATLRPRFAWIKFALGPRGAREAQEMLPFLKRSVTRNIDRMAFGYERLKRSPDQRAGRENIGTQSAQLPSWERAQASLAYGEYQTHCCIPKRIIQTAKSANFPLPTRAMVANVKLLNPDFEYLFFDNSQVETFIDREFPQYRSVFNSFRFTIQKYDFFRYLAVYRYGGFYFDLDVLLASSLAPLLGFSCVFAFEALNYSPFMRNHLGMDWLLGNYAFGAAPGHPFLEAVIKNCIKAHEDPAWVQPMMSPRPPLMRDEYFVVNTTGPGLISRTLAENRELADSVTVLFPADICDRRNWNHFGPYGLHWMHGTWRPNRSLLRRKFTDYSLSWLLRRAARQSFQTGPISRHPKCIIWGAHER